MGTLVYFSVILPTYNRSVSIRPSIDSVVGQTEEDWELIIVSDGSTDDTEAIIESYVDSRVRLVRLSKNTGHPGRPRNVGLSYANGQVVAYLDHDDRYEPEHLAILREMFVNNKTRVAVTGCWYFDQFGKAIKCSSILETVWHPEFQVFGPLFQPSRVAHRCEVARERGGWTEKLFGLEDWDFWLRLADSGERFVTSSVETVAIYNGSDTRLNRVPMRYALTVARFRSKEEAQNRLHLLTTPEVIAEMRSLQVNAVQRWFDELYERREIRLPKGLTLEQVRSLVLEEEIPQTAPCSLAIRSHAGSVSVVIPLMCVSAEHAARIKTLFEHRFSDVFRFIREILCVRTAELT